MCLSCSLALLLYLWLFIFVYAYTCGYDVINQVSKRVKKSYSPTIGLLRFQILYGQSNEHLFVPLMHGVDFELFLFILNRVARFLLVANDTITLSVMSYFMSRIWKYSSIVGAYLYCSEFKIHSLVDPNIRSLFWGGNYLCWQSVVMCSRTLHFLSFLGPP